MQIDYNLHVTYARLGEYTLEKSHLDTAVDRMYRMLLEAEKGTSTTSIVDTKHILSCIILSVYYLS